ncbi:hypothetical protein [Phormidium tenue]|uniref:hypothetical protein n=1 Tax=Phormidium tenue TaxID=126344 RepID=UPI0030D95C9F
MAIANYNLLYKSKKGRRNVPSFFLQLERHCQIVFSPITTNIIAIAFNRSGLSSS